jgi:hypothetical protein
MLTSAIALECADAGVRGRDAREAATRRNHTVAAARHHRAGVTGNIVAQERMEQHTLLDRIPGVARQIKMVAGVGFEPTTFRL